MSICRAKDVAICGPRLLSERESGVQLAASSCPEWFRNRQKIDRWSMAKISGPVVAMSMRLQSGGGAFSKPQHRKAGESSGKGGESGPCPFADSGHGRDKERPACPLCSLATGAR